MKQLMILLLGFLIMACSTLKNKEVSTSNFTNTLSSEESTNVSTSSASNYNLKIKDTVSTKQLAVKTDFTSNSLQSLSLRNTGKCDDVGKTEYLTYKDIQGNEYNIPVNNNTELSFGSESKQNHLIDSISAENYALRYYLEDAVKKNDSLITVSKELFSSLTETNEQLKKKTQRPMVGVVLFWCLLSIVVYKIVEVQVKKLIFK